MDSNYSKGRQFAEAWGQQAVDWRKMLPSFGFANDVVRGAANFAQSIPVRNFVAGATGGNEIARQVSMPLGPVTRATPENEAKYAAKALQGTQAKTPAKAAAAAAAEPLPLTPDAILRNLAAKQGGAVSLKQLKYVSDYAQGTRPAATRPVSAQDQISMHLANYYQQQFEKAMASARSEDEQKQISNQYTSALAELVTRKPDPFPTFEGE